MGRVKFKNRVNINLSVILSCLFIFFLIYSTFTLAGQLIRFVQNNGHLNKVDREIQMAKVQRTKLEQQKSHANTNEYVERIAKEKLNMINKDEVIVNMDSNR